MSTVNPCSFFVNGNDKKSFTFTPGNKMFQVKIYGSSAWIPFSAMLMADDEVHVRSILGALVNFRLECDKEYQAYREEQHRRYPDMDDADVYRGKMIEFTNHLGAWLYGKRDSQPEGFQVLISEINPNQLFKVSWASNDTLLS